MNSTHSRRSCRISQLDVIAVVPDKTHILSNVPRSLQSRVSTVRFTADVFVTILGINNLVYICIYYYFDRKYSTSLASDVNIKRA